MHLLSVCFISRVYLQLKISAPVCLNFYVLKVFLIFFSFLKVMLMMMMMMIVTIARKCSLCKTANYHVFLCTLALLLHACQYFCVRNL